MNREDIISMAREACDTDKVDAWHNGFWCLTQDELERFAALVAAAEREACASFLERGVDMKNLNNDPAWSRYYGRYTVDLLLACAAAIRARGVK